MASPAIDIIRKKVPQEIGGNAFLKKAPQERTRSIKVLLVASVSAGVHLVLGILLAPLFTVAFLAANTPSHPIIFGNINGPTLAVLFPILYGVIGFLVGAAAAAIYNSLARHMFPPEPTVPEVEEEAGGLEIVYSRSAELG